MEHSFLDIEQTPPVATVRLNRPEVRNAMHIGMIRELTAMLRELERQEEIRILQLSAAGPDFCSGADLNWMQEGMKQAEDVLRSESLELAGVFHSLATTRLIVIASVRGRARGGALGLVAASDLVVAEPDASFAFSEVRLGLVPATIAPYVILKIGVSRAKELMVSGREFSGEMALRYGLVHHLSGSQGLEAATDQRVKELLRNGPQAMRGVKSLFYLLGNHPDAEGIRELTAEMIARHRTSTEGQEGMRAFFEKRKPSWE